LANDLRMMMNERHRGAGPECPMGTVPAGRGWRARQVPNAFSVAATTTKARLTMKK